jgi:hypothetical protein
VGDAQLGHLRAQEREHGMRVVPGALVDREDLEVETEPAQMGRDALHGRADHVLVVPERQDGADVEPRAGLHRPAS